MPSKTKRRPSVTRKLKIVMLSCLVVVAALVVGAAMLQDQERTKRAEAEAASFTPAPIPTPEQQMRVAFLGDSYTEGDGAEDKTSTRFSKLVSNRMGWRELNLGAGGTGYVQETPSGQKYAARVPEVAALNPDMVIVSGGRNDMNPSSEAITGFYNTLREALPETPIVALQPMYDSKPYPERLVETSRMVEQAVTAIGGTYVPVPNPLEGRPELINADGVHPTAEGHKLLADEIEKGLLSALPDLAPAE